MSIERLTPRLRGCAIALLGVAALLAATPRPAAAGEPASGTAASSPAPHSRATQAQLRSPAAAHGVVITWNESAKRFESPAAEQASELARELRSLLAGETGRRAGLAEKVEVEVLPNGLARARVPASLMNLSVIRPAGGGTFAPVCSQGPDEARQDLMTPYLGSGPVER